MSILDRIAAAGLNNSPIDGELLEIKTKAESLVTKAINKVLKCNDDAKKLSSTISESKESQKSIIPQADGMIAKIIMNLDSLIKAFNKAVKGKKSYQDLHGLIHEPINPNALINIMVFGIMVFGESLINTGFFQNAHMTATPVAAFMISILISLTNVMASCVGGFFIGRRLNYGINAKDKNQFLITRLIARFSQLIFITTMGGFHLTIGLVRTQETLSKIEHSMAAYSELLHTPEAIFLILIGVCLSVISWHKAQSAFSDPYINYGEKQKAIEQSHEEIEDSHEDATDEIETFFDDAISADNEYQEQHQDTVESYNKVVSKSHTTYLNLEKIVSHAEGQLATETSQILDVYSASGGDKYDDFDIKKHCSFQDYLDIELPEYLPVPEKSSRNKDALNEAKAMALERIATLFTNNTNLNIGEK
jgi:uncharacterized protein YxeA